MKITFELEIDEQKPTGKSSAGNPKWVAQTEFQHEDSTFAIFIDIYKKVSKTTKVEPKKPVIKAKAS